MKPSHQTTIAGLILVMGALLGNESAWAQDSFEAERLRLVLMAVDSEVDEAGGPIVTPDRRMAVALCVIDRLPWRWAEEYPDSRLTDRQAFEAVIRGPRTGETRENLDRLALLVVEGVSLCAREPLPAPLS